jgi:hypothetical protein
MVVLVNPTAIFFFRDFAHLVDAHANFFVSNAATSAEKWKKGESRFLKTSNSCSASHGAVWQNSPTLLVVV